MCVNSLSKLIQISLTRNDSTPRDLGEIRKDMEQIARRRPDNEDVLGNVVTKPTLLSLGHQGFDFLSKPLASFPFPPSP